jgi:hypothetical protein
MVKNVYLGFFDKFNLQKSELQFVLIWTGTRYYWIPICISMVPDSTGFQFVFVWYQILLDSYLCRHADRFYWIPICMGMIPDSTGF